jgi:pyruvate,water dikinase
MEKSEKNILWFNEVRMEDVPLVGGKNASLGEMYTQLTSKGVNVPYGFAITASFYWKFIKENNLDKNLSEIFKNLDPKNLQSVRAVGKAAREKIATGIFTDELKKDLFEAYAKLSQLLA